MFLSIVPHLGARQEDGCDLSPGAYRAEQEAQLPSSRLQAEGPQVSEVEGKMRKDRGKRIKRVPSCGEAGLASQQNTAIAQSYRMSTRRAMEPAQFHGIQGA